jgi:uncharacterized RDD family membrane protein YckC
MVDHTLGDADYYDETQYAGFGSRLLVIAVDSLVLLMAGMAIWIPFEFLLISGVLENDPSGPLWLIYLVGVWIYLAPIKRSDFGTVGFRLLGLTLVSAKGGKPSLLNMTMRMMIWMFGPFNLLLDLLWLGADAERQSLRDCYLGTYLVKRDSVPIGRAPVHLTHYNAMGFTLSYPRVCRPRNSV